MSGIARPEVRFFFGNHRLDLDRRELARGPDLISIGPQVFDTLAYLLTHRDRVVSKDELLDVIWQGRIVSESTLTSHINAVRKAVGDSGNTQDLIRTVARKGFRFVGAVKEDDANAAETAISALGNSLQSQILYWRCRIGHRSRSCRSRI